MDAKKGLSLIYCVIKDAVVWFIINDQKEIKTSIRQLTSRCDDVSNTWLYRSYNKMTTSNSFEEVDICLNVCRINLVWTQINSIGRCFRICAIFLVGSRNWDWKTCWDIKLCPDSILVNRVIALCARRRNEWVSMADTSFENSEDRKHSPKRYNLSRVRIRVQFSYKYIVILWRYHMSQKPPTCLLKINEYRMYLKQ